MRRATALEHERVEAMVDVEAATASRAAYIELLRRQLGFYGPIEARLAATPIAGELPFDILPRASLLEQDLRDLRANGHVPRSEDLPCVDTLEQLAGCLYVVEGAALGGRVIAKLVRAQLGLVDEGVRFFTGHGDVRERWVAVLSWLETVGARGADREVIVAGARATFAAFARWLECAA